MAPVLGNSAAKEIAFEELSIEGSLRASIVGMTGVLPGLTTIGTASDYPNLSVGPSSFVAPAGRLTLPVSSGRASACCCGRLMPDC